MVLVDDVDVIQIRGSGFVGEVDRVRQRQVPDGKRLKLGVTGGDAALVRVVDLRQAGRELAGAGARRGHDDEVAGSFGVLVEPEALVGDDAGGVVGVARDNAVARYLQAEALETLHESFGRGVARLKLRDHDVVHQESPAAEDVDKAQHVVFVGDAEVRADLLAQDVLGVDAHHDLDLILDALEHGDLVVRGKSGQDTAGVVVVEKFATHFQVQLSTDLRTPGTDVLRLHLDVLLAVKTYGVRHQAVLSRGNLRSLARTRDNARTRRSGYWSPYRCGRWPRRREAGA